MARSFRTACLIAVPLTAALGVLPATAQFVNPFEALFGSPPRPPSGVPSGRQQAPQQGYPQQGYPPNRDDQYPDPQYQQPYPGQARQAPPAGGVQNQPLPPPDGTTAAVDPRAPGGPMALPGQRQPRGTPQGTDTSPQPGDEVIAEPPSQRIANQSALFSGLDKITRMKVQQPERLPAFHGHPPGHVTGPDAKPCNRRSLWACGPAPRWSRWADAPPACP